jgi:hypothetical protein
MAESSQLPDRIQRDLEEALRQGGVDKLPSHNKRPRKKLRLGWPDPRPRNPGDLVLFGVVLFLAWLLVPPSFPLRPQLMVAAIVCVVVAVATYFMQPQGHVRHYWRGRYLDIPSGRWQEQIYRIIYRQSSR